jgi:hypothetical protein
VTTERISDGENDCQSGRNIPLDSNNELKPERRLLGRYGEPHAERDSAPPHTVDTRRPRKGSRGGSGYGIKGRVS